MLAHTPKSHHYRVVRPPQSDDEPVLDVQELAHYSRVENGSVHLSVPGEMLFCPTPDDLPADKQWADYSREDGRTARRFSGEFYASLFENLQVSVVVCLGTGSATTNAALEEHGIESVDLGLAADGSSLLRGLDALLSLARAAPGVVAVHSGEGFEWPGYTGTLEAAFMMRRLGFEEGSARAWLGMVSPWMLTCGTAAAVNW